MNMGGKVRHGFIDIVPLKKRLGERMSSNEALEEGWSEHHGGLRAADMISVGMSE